MILQQVVNCGTATRYAFEEGANVHCPDVVILHSAASKCKIPVLAFAKVVLGVSRFETGSQFLFNFNCRLIQEKHLRRTTSFCTIY